MNVVGRVGSLISQGVYSVATPFHPFGGAVDIIAVEQPDGSYRSTPWYVRFGKFQGVLKGAEKVVTITVNGVEANFHMLLDNSGQAYFMRELVPGSEDSTTGSEQGAINETEPPARSKSDGELYIGISNRMDSGDLNVENEEKQSTDEFEAYGYGRLEEVEEGVPKQDDGGNSEVVLVSVDGHVLTAPISSTEESVDDVQLRDPQFHLGPGESSSGDFSRSGEVWEAGIVGDIYLSQEKVKFDSGHQSGLLEERAKVIIEKDESHHISVDGDESFHVSDNEVGVLHVSVNENEAYAVSANEDEAQDVSRSGNNDEGDQTQTLSREDEFRGVLENNNAGYQPLTSKDESRGVSGNNDPGYQPLTSEDKSAGMSADNASYQSLTNDHGNNDGDHQPLLTDEDESRDAPVPDKANDCRFPANEDDVCELSNEDIEMEGVGASLGKNESCDAPVPDKANNCRSPANEDEVCELNNEDIEMEGVGASLGKYDTFKSCLDLTSQMDEADSGNELFSPESDHQRDSELSFSNHSVVETDLVEDDSKTAYCNQDDSLQGVDMPTVTSENNMTESNRSSHHGKESNLSPKGSCDRSKIIASVKVKAGQTDGLQASMDCSDKDKLGSIPEHSEGEEELDKEVNSQLQKGLGVEISLCGHVLRVGMGRESAEEAFQQHLVCEEDFKSSGLSIIKNSNLIVKADNKYFPWSKVSHVILGKAVFGPDFCIEPADAIPVEHPETPSSRDSSLGMSPSSRRWRLWPIPFRISRSLQRSNSDSSEDIFLDTETVLSPMDEQIPEQSKSQSPRKQFVRTLIPTSEQVASLNLKEGQNLVTFSFSTRVLGRQQVDAHIYLWKWNAKIVISDVDGTITRSDVLGQVMPLVGRDWSQSGVARLFSAIKENGYQLIFLSARAIVQAYLTKNFLFNLKQDGKALPNGPVVISPDGLFPSLYREVIRRAPHEFKIACLEDIKALFPSDYNPFYAGFGNRDTDELSYKKMGIPKGKIFIINPKGEVAVNSSVDVKSYTSLHTLVNDMFPPTTLVEQEDYNSWNYWKMPLPDVDL
ncbi:hypothetical protein QOZ80_5AG0370390 [Eleusine coracana subsp. coracana]|nr:hypothetical protein QOZ80_5AG0370390 [Eleusine coracana subsp. coracana]